VLRRCRLPLAWVPPRCTTYFLYSVGIQVDVLVCRLACVSLMWESRFSAGDIVTLVFSSPTNTPSASSIVSFTPSIGVTAASWLAGGTQLVVRVVDASGVNTTAVDVATSSLRVAVAGVRSASGLSSPSLLVRRAVCLNFAFMPLACLASFCVMVYGSCLAAESSPACSRDVVQVNVTVNGTWGAPSPPAILQAVAVDAARTPGLTSGDAVVSGDSTPFHYAATLFHTVVSVLLLGGGGGGWAQAEGVE
jgi:hypothetical protein